jgi:hypothetical protein
MLFPFSFLQAQGPTYDVDALAFFARVDAATGVPNSLTLTEKTATNQLVLDLKANSLWTPMKAIYPMVGASAAACKQNLKSSSFTGSFTSGWTFASTGVTGNGTSAYFDSNLNCSTQLTKNNTCVTYYSRTNNAMAYTDFGAYVSSTSTIYTQIRYTGDLLYAGIGSEISGSDITVANTSSLGFYQTNRTASNNLKVFKNSSLFATRTGNDTGTLGNLNLYFNALNTSTVAVTFSNRQCAFASIGDGLTDTQASDFYTAVQAFQTTLSRNV